jgi:hypothetical protein
MLKERGKEMLNRKLGSKLLAPLTEKTTQGFGEPYDSQALGTGSCWCYCDTLTAVGRVPVG